jgi:hypothetical protein
MSDDYSHSPPTFGRISRLKGFLPLSTEEANPVSIQWSFTAAELELIAN